MKFKIAFYYEESGVVDVEADSKEDAENRLMAELNDGGLEKISTKPGFSITHRDFDTIYFKDKKRHTKRGI